MKHALLLSLVALGTAAEAQPNDRISGPFVHDNLAVFLIHGADQLTGSPLLTLAEAMRSKKVIVHETGNVDELMIENVSDQEVFLHAGDIVKGGKQDRTLQSDAILPRRSGKVPVASFCVESGRWAARQGEAVGRFDQSNKALASKSLKVAARKSRDQGAVWREVATTQQKLEQNVGRDVKSARSETSLQLTLENGDVAARIQAYVATLGPLPARHADAIGYAFAINGRINSAEIYGSAALFRELWPKLLEASATEALSERASGAVQAATEADVRKLLQAPAKAKREARQVTPRTQVVTQDSGDNVMFETRDGDRWVHKSYY